jgi:iron-sulfur cluster assembly protein
MAISLTPAAAERVKTFIASRGKGLGLRLGVRKTGVLGIRLCRHLRDDTQAQDLVFETAGSRCSSIRRACRSSNGTTVDFVKQGLNEAFRFHNPNIKGECGLRGILQRLKAAVSAGIFARKWGPRPVQSRAFQPTYRNLSHGARAHFLHHQARRRCP